MNKESWDDIRFVLAVSRKGSLNAAAHALGVTHATVLRRVASFEKRYGLKLFEKSQSGYRNLVEADEIFRAVEAVETAVLRLERSISGGEQSPSGLVRIASTDSISQMILPKCMKELQRRYPRISLVLLSGNSHHDLTRLSADIVIRPAVKLGEELIGARTVNLDFGVYASDSAPKPWLSLRGALKKSKPALWMASNKTDESATLGADSFLVLQELAALGLGKALMPRFLGDADSRLVALSDSDPEISVPIWVATLEEVSETPRFELIRDALIEILKGDQRLRPENAG